MPIAGIDHINIAASMETLESCVEFYSAVLGLERGYRPPFESRGFWLYAGDAPIVHLTEAGADATGPSGALNHVALACSDIESVEATLRARNVPFTTDRVPMTSQVQIFLRDPAGVRLELNFEDAQ